MPTQQAAQRRDIDQLTGGELVTRARSWIRPRGSGSISCSAAGLPEQVLGEDLGGDASAAARSCPRRAPFRADVIEQGNFTENGTDWPVVAGPREFGREAAAQVPGDPVHRQRPTAVRNNPR